MISRLDREDRIEFGDLDHVDELVKLLLDLLHLGGIDHDGHSRHAVFMGRPDCQRVDVESATSQAAMKPWPDPRLVLDDDRDKCGSWCLTSVGRFRREVEVPYLELRYLRTDRLPTWVLPSLMAGPMPATSLVPSALG